MEKYRIVPENCKRLGQLLAGMEQTAQEGKLLDAAVIRHVEVTPARNMWELLIWSLDKLPEELLDRGRDYVTAKHDLQEVRFYTTVIKLEKVLEVMDAIDCEESIRDEQRTAERECHR